MNKINTTVGLCEYCYRHIPGHVVEENGSIFLVKECPDHGTLKNLVDPDADFYLNYKYIKKEPRTYLIELTNRCNLACPHCYQIPDNQSKDQDISFFVNKIKSWNDDGYNICFAGAEPTIRKDLKELIESVNNIDQQKREIIILSNGVKLSD